MYKINIYKTCFTIKIKKTNHNKKFMLSKAFRHMSASSSGYNTTSLVMKACVEMLCFLA